MSLTDFLVLTGIYILVGGLLSGGIAAWMARSGASPMGHLVTAFRSRIAGRPRGLDR